ncbi:uncharacterized protein LOC127436096 [Myxocyprinus asiaticus]|uniref:uncharacterized protein LOC127436096 n=1 Tax=Myxocyprinus asiaticus TaxID=70543 RepID=UPI0022239414|nr:uncharacterized protein LOC127436096 [Myxocyprinus asiaticus]
MDQDNFSRYYNSEDSQTLVHKLHYKQLQVFTNFLACFVQSEHLNPIPKALATLEFDGKLLHVKEMYVGRDADQFRVAHPQHPLLKPFLQQVSRAYTTCAKFLQKKLPLQSKTLQCLSAMDPVVRGHSQPGFELKKLTQMISHILPPDADTHQEILQYSVDQTLPTFKEGDEAVTWWVSVFETGKYPGLCQAVKAAMSIFHGPLVESSFNLMGDIIDPRS